MYSSEFAVPVLLTFCRLFLVRSNSTCWPKADCMHYILAHIFRAAKHGTHVALLEGAACYFHLKGLVWFGVGWKKGETSCDSARL